MNYKEVAITPEMAEAMLASNSVNRNLNMKRAAQYAVDMKMGAWQLNGEAIKFYEDGTLADGQHRLKAITIAGKPVRFVVITGLPKNITVQDRGRLRSPADQLLTEGAAKAIATNKNVSVARLHYDLQSGKRIVSDGQIATFLERYGDTLVEVADMCKDSSGKGKKGKKALGARVNIDNSPVRLAVFYAINSGEYSKELANSFTKVLKTGIPENMSQTAAIVCRNDILSGVISGHSGESRRESVHKIEKALSDFAAGYQRKITYASWKTPIYSCHANNREVL